MMTEAEKREEIERIKADITWYEAQLDALYERLDELQAEPDWDLIAKEKDL